VGASETDLTRTAPEPRPPVRAPREVPARGSGGVIWFTVSLNLAAYLERFGEVCRSKYGQRYDFARLEKMFAYLRSEDQWLTAGHVGKVFDSRNTPFARYWPSPNLRELDQTLRKARLRLAPLGADPRGPIEKLLAVFHNLGTVSILLRFTYPERFAVMSTPIVNLLQIHPSNSVQLYLDYCDELRDWQEHFRLRSVAETETALWTYQQIAAGEQMAPGKGAGWSDAAGALERDLWVQRRRAAQVLRPLLSDHGPLELARILAEESPKLAAMIAGEEYERRLRAAAARHYPAVSTRGARWAYNLISLMAQDGLVALEHRHRLDEIWDLRNAAVHGNHKRDLRLDALTVERMIDGIETICARWESPRGRARR
jgi:hypothetical protein